MKTPDLVKSEPVLAITGAAAVVGYVMTSLVAHGVITSIQASADTKAVLPPVTALFLLCIGFVVRHFVSPAVHWIQGELATIDNAPFIAEIKKAVAEVAAEALGQVKLDGGKLATYMRDLSTLQARGLSPALVQQLATAGPTTTPAPAPKPSVDQAQAFAAATPPVTAPPAPTA